MSDQEDTVEIGSTELSILPESSEDTTLLSSPQDDYSFFASAVASSISFDNEERITGPRRKGKWTTEEENYANRIILYFSKGMLSIPTGTTLRTFLSDELHCDPMRITKKYAGTSCIGKQVFQPSNSGRDSEEIQGELAELRKLFLDRFLNRTSQFALTSPNHDEDDEDEREEDYVRYQEDVHSGSSSSSSRIDVTASHSEPSSSQHSSYRNIIKSYYLLEEGGDSRRGREKDSHNMRTSLGLTKSRKYASAPDLAVLASMNSYSGASLQQQDAIGGRSKRQRSQSVMDLEEYATDIAAAGDLFLSFMHHVHSDHNLNLNVDKEQQENDRSNLMNVATDEDDYDGGINIDEDDDTFPVQHKICVGLSAGVAIESKSDEHEANDFANSNDDNDDSVDDDRLEPVRSSMKRVRSKSSVNSKISWKSESDC